MHDFNWFLAILCDLFGMFKWPFQWFSDLQLGDKKVTLNHLVPNFQLNCFCFSWSWLLHWEKIIPGTAVVFTFSGAFTTFRTKHWWNFLGLGPRGPYKVTTNPFFFPPVVSLSADHCRWFARQPRPLWLTHRGQRRVLTSIYGVQKPKLLTFSPPPLVGRQENEKKRGNTCWDGLKISSWSGRVRTFAGSLVTTRIVD